MSIFSASSAVTRTTSSKPGALALFGVFAGLSLFGATGCVAEVQAEPAYATYSAPVAYEEPVAYDDVEYVAAAPVNVELYPRVYYGGTYVYYVEGRWYAPGPRGWCYYRHEPRSLVSYRVDFDRRYPHGAGYAHGYAGGHAHVDVHSHVYSRSRPAPAHHTAPAHRSYRTVHASVSAGHHHH